MSLPVPTTTISILRAQRAAAADAFDPDTGPAVTVATGVPAHFNRARGSESPAGSSTARTTVLLADPCDLQHVDVVVDESDGSEWEVGDVDVVTDPDRPPPENDSHVTANVTRAVGVTS